MRTVAAKSIRNSMRPDKPNEDAFVADDVNGIYIIADGVTSPPMPDGTYPVPSGGRLASALFCQVVHNALTDLPTRSAEDVVEAIALANDAIGELNRAREADDRIDHVNGDLYCTVATIGVEIEEALHVWHLGDCLLVTGQEGALSRVTECQTQAMAEYFRRTRAAWQASPDAKARDWELMLRVRKEARNSATAVDEHGLPVGYGVFTGQRAALDFLRQRTIPLTGSEIFLFASDGLESSCEKLCAMPTASSYDADLLAWLFADSDQEEPGIGKDDRTAFIVKAV